MEYDLDRLQELSRNLGFDCSRLSPDELEIQIESDVFLVFQNLRDEEETLIGFRGTPWHSHGYLMLMSRDGTYVEIDELEVLQNLKDGNLVIVEMYVENELRDRWLAYREEQQNIQYITPGEEIRIRRLP